MSDQQVASPAYFIYAGRIADNTRHLYYVLIDLALNDGIKRARVQCDTFLTDKKAFKRGTIGAIYPIMLENGGNRATYKKDTGAIAYWKTNDDLIEWRATDSAAEVVNVIEKTGKQNKMFDALAPIAYAYRKAKTNQARAAVLAEVIRYITS